MVWRPPIKIVGGGAYRGGQNVVEVEERTLAMSSHSPFPTPA